MVKAGTVLIVGALGVLAVIAYLVYRSVKSVQDTVSAPFVGFGKGIDAINQGFGSALGGLDSGANAVLTGAYNAGYGLGDVLGTHSHSELIDPSKYNAPPVTGIYGPNPITASQKRLFGGY